MNRDLKREGRRRQGGGAERETQTDRQTDRERERESSFMRRKPNASSKAILAPGRLEPYHDK